MDISELSTPALVVYLDKVKKNANDMLERCKKYGVNLRPHFKTSKVIEVAELQTGGTKRSLVVSTLAEAKHLAENGFDDILYAIPLSEDKDKLNRCMDLNKTLDNFHVMIDSIEMVDVLSDSIEDGGKKWSVFINVDCGYHRAGVPYNSENAVKLVKRLHGNEKTMFQGLYTHCGHSYNANNDTSVQNVADDVINALLLLVEKLKSEDIKCPTFGLGSTPTCSQPTDLMRKVTEWHPGNYVFNDVQQEMLGSCKREDIACEVVTRILAHYSENGLNHMLVDCGWTALTTQGFGKVPSGGYGAIVDHPELKLASMTQELGKITTVDGSKIQFEKYPTGSMLSILPYHSCATCCMHPVYNVADAKGKIIEKWIPVRGW